MSACGNSISTNHFLNICIVTIDTIRVYNTHLQSYRLKADSNIKKIISNLNSNYSKQIEQAVDIFGFTLYNMGFDVLPSKLKKKIKG